MATQYLVRRSIALPATSKAGAAPIYVDSDDNIVKVIPAGSGTTEVQLLDASSSQTLTNKTLTSPIITGALTTSGVGTKNGSTVSVVEYGSGDTIHKTVFTLASTPVTIAKATTVSGGGGVLLYTFPSGYILPVGGTSNLTLADAVDGSWVGSLGTATAATDGTLTSTEGNILPSAAATISTGTGTLKLLSTAAAPAAGVPLQTTAPVVAYLNFALPANATGGETMTVSGTITLVWTNLGVF